MDAMTYDEVKILLEKVNWILESESPLNIRSKDGEHFAQNFAAELVIEFFAGLNDDVIEEYAEQFKLIDTKNDTSRIEKSE